MVFELITSATYWILFILWSAIFLLYLFHLRKHQRYGYAVTILLLILALDAFRTLVESAYFGTYFTSLYGFLPHVFYETLSKPGLLIMPKLVNLVAGLLVLFLLIRHWLPRESAERALMQQQLSESESQLRQAIVDSPLPTFIHADDGKILMTSSIVHEMSGYQPEEMTTVEQWVKLAYPNDPHDKMHLINTQYDGSKKHLGELTITTREGEQRIWDFHIGPLGKTAEGHQMHLSVAHDVTDKKRLEALHDLETYILEAVTSNATLPQLLEEVVLGIEKLMPDALASILLLGDNGLTLSEGAAPHLPAAYSEAIYGEPIGPKTGSCGTAAFLKQTVVVSDIQRDPLWEDYKTLAAQYQLAACWSEPVFDENNQVLATFALYYNKPKTPKQTDLQLIHRIAKIVAIVIGKKRDAARLAATEQRFQKIFESAATGVAVTTIDGRFLQANKAYCEMLGFSDEELKSIDFKQIMHPDDASSNIEKVQAVLKGQRDSIVLEKRYLTKTGDTVWARKSISVQRDAQNTPLQLVMIAENISEIKLAEQRQKEAENTLTKMLSNLPGVAYRMLYDSQWTMLYVSDAFEALTGYNPNEVLRNKTTDYNQITHPDDRERVFKEIKAAVQQHQSFQVEYRIVRKDGGIRWVLEQGSALFDDQGKPETLEGYLTDITPQKTADALIRESEERFQLLSKATNDAIWDWNLLTNEIWWNDGYESQFGLLEDEPYPTLDSWINRIHPEDRDRVVSSLHGVIEKGEDFWIERYRFLKSDDSYLEIAERGHVIYDAQNQAVRMVGGMSDETKRWQLEEQLRQSQRLEAVGQLTGGVAHDFNNLLTVIIGNAEIMTESLDQDSKLHVLSEMIQEAAYRGAKLTASLLAFARRQPLDPKNIDVNQLLDGLASLLKRAIGEETQVDWVLSEGLWLAQVDPAQLENAILNLALNARDAMPLGGKLMIETQNITVTDDYAYSHDMTAGKYIQLSVSDTGGGIEPDNIARVFEPFFSTKIKEKGTGLGLAMVYGFIKQSNGHINIYSELNEGTTIKLYLPAAADTAKAVAYSPKRTNKLSTGNETILVVEDDALVRAYVVSQLRTFGYHVYEAAHGVEALNILKQQSNIDLLFTDVVMPHGISGRELSLQAKALLPELRVLFTSGYTENSIIHHGRLDEGVQLLSKPYNRDELAEKIRQTLDT